MKLYFAAAVFIFVFASLPLLTLAAECRYDPNEALACTDGCYALEYDASRACIDACNAKYDAIYKEFLACVKTQEQQKAQQPPEVPTPLPQQLPPPQPQTQPQSPPPVQSVGKFASPEANESYQSVMKCLDEQGWSAVWNGVGSPSDNICLKRAYQIADSLWKPINGCPPDSSGAPSEACAGPYRKTMNEVFNAIDAALMDWTAAHPQPKPEEKAPIIAEEEPKPEEKAPITAEEERHNRECAGSISDDQQYQSCLKRKSAIEAARARIQYSRTDKSTKKNTVYTAPSDKKAVIDINNGMISVKEGSSLQYLAEDTWKAIKGVFHVVIDSLAKPRMKVTSPNAIAGVRGTQYVLEANGNTTTVKVLKGAVTLSDAANKKSVVVKEGFQASVKDKTVGKAAKFTAAGMDAWYNSAPPSEKVWDEGWKKVAAATLYKKECVTKAGQATPAVDLTAEEQEAVKNFNAAIAKFRVKETQSIDERAKKLHIFREKSDIKGTRSVNIYLDAQKFYYPGSKPNTWKAYKDAKTAGEFFSQAHNDNLTSPFDKSTFTFDHWAGAMARTAYHAGTYTPDGVARLISNLSGAEAEPGQPLADVMIQADGETQLWNRYETNITIKSGKITFPINQTCVISYGNGVKVKLPSKFQSMDASTGEKELYEASQTVQ